MVLAATTAGVRESWKNSIFKLISWYPSFIAKISKKMDIP